MQIYHGGGYQQQNWSACQRVEENLAIHAPEVDRPMDGLLTDLAQRGRLDDTRVVWGASSAVNRSAKVPTVAAITNG